MFYGIIKVTALEARRAAKLYNKAVTDKTQNSNHPDVIAAGRMVQAYGLVPDNHYVEVSVTSPLVEYIRPHHLPQLNEQGFPVNTQKSSL